MAESRLSLTKIIWGIWLLMLGLTAGYALGYWQFEYNEETPPQAAAVECPEQTPLTCEDVPPLETAEDYLARGIDLWNRGFYAVPVSDVNTAIEMDPTLADAYFYRGWITHEGYWDKQNNPHNDLESAIADYSHAIELDPNHSRAYNNRGVAYVQKNEITSALADFERAIEIDPGYRMANFNLIQVAAYRQMYQDAVEYCQNWEEHNQSLPVQSCLHAAEKEGDYAFLIAMLDRKIEYYEEYGWQRELYEHYRTRGRAYREWGHYAEALADLERAVKIGEEEELLLCDYNSDIVSIYLDMVKVYVAQDDLPRAFDELSILILNYPDEPDLYWQRADLYYDQGSYAQALADYYQAQKLLSHPSDEIAERITEIEQMLADE